MRRPDSLDVRPPRTGRRSRPVTVGPLRRNGAAQGGGRRAVRGPARDDVHTARSPHHQGPPPAACDDDLLHIARIVRRDQRLDRTDECGGFELSDAPGDLRHVRRRPPVHRHDPAWTGSHACAAIDPCRDGFSLEAWPAPRAGRAPRSARGPEHLVSIDNQSVPSVISRVVLSVVILAAAAACGDAPTTPGGVSSLTQTDLVVGSGAVAAVGNSITVNYTGWLYDPTKTDNKGLEFDTSTGRDPFTFTLGSRQVIEGWDQGLVNMRVGGTRRLL